MIVRGTVRASSCATVGVSVVSPGSTRVLHVVRSSVRLKKIYIRDFVVVHDQGRRKSGRCSKAPLAEATRSTTPRLMRQVQQPSLPLIQYPPRGLWVRYPALQLHTESRLLSRVYRSYTPCRLPKCRGLLGSSCASSYKVRERSGRMFRAVVQSLAHYSQTYGLHRYEMRRQCQEILPGVLLGPMQASKSLETLQKHGITHM